MADHRKQRGRTAPNGAELSDEAINKLVDMLKDEYDRAVKSGYVRRPLAFALYKVWRKIDAKGGMDNGAEHCICCGEVIPEGRQVCPRCEESLKEDGNG